MIVDSIIDICRPMTTPPPVFPFYIASWIRRALSTPDARVPEQIIDTRSVKLGCIGIDCQYELYFKDFNGQQYRVTVELEEDAKRRDEEYGQLIQCRGALRLIKAASEAKSSGSDPLAFIASLAKETLDNVEGRNV